MKPLLSLLVACACHCPLFGQEEHWDVYMARYEKGVGSVTLNMDLIGKAPVEEMPFLVITGVTFKKCTGEGFPEKDEFSKLYKVSDDINEVLFSLTKSELAGTFTYQCQRLDYIYVHDTLNIRKKISDAYLQKHKQYQYHINIRPDKLWEGYTTFLYPNEDTKEYMSNEKVLNNLREAGDNLNEPRIVEHWIYFESKEGRDTFIKYVTRIKFKVEVKDLKDSEKPFQLHISRFDKVDLEAITGLTKSLRERAKEFGGEYDGWETSVVKK